MLVDSGQATQCTRNFYKITLRWRCNYSTNSGQLEVRFNCLKKFASSIVKRSSLKLIINRYEAQLVHSLLGSIRLVLFVLRLELLFHRKWLGRWKFLKRQSIWESVLDSKQNWSRQLVLECEKAISSISTRRPIGLAEDMRLHIYYVGSLSIVEGDQESFKPGPENGTWGMWQVYEDKSFLSLAMKRF